MDDCHEEVHEIFKTIDIDSIAKTILVHSFVDYVCKYKIQLSEVLSGNNRQPHPEVMGSSRAVLARYNWGC